MLSDKISDSKLKKQLLSESRYHNCHENTPKVAASLDEETRKKAYIVGGKIKCNDIDYLYHSWVEIDDLSAVIDFNNNIIMKKEDYYKLFGAISINKTNILDMMQIIEMVCLKAKLRFHQANLNYFGNEIMNDLKKNEKIFRKI